MATISFPEVSVKNILDIIILKSDRSFEQKVFLFKTNPTISTVILKHHIQGIPEFAYREKHICHGVVCRIYPPHYISDEGYVR